METAEVLTRASDLGDPSAGLRAVAALRRLTETLELRQVEAALAAGLGWVDVGQALGVSRQAVHKKYRSRIRPDLAPRHGGCAMRARTAMAWNNAAWCEAERVREALVDVDHQLLGCSPPEGLRRDCSPVTASRWSRGAEPCSPPTPAPWPCWASTPRCRWWPRARPVSCAAAPPRPRG